jgi:hypothetical protein
LKEASCVGVTEIATVEVFVQLLPSVPVTVYVVPVVGDTETEAPVPAPLFQE